MKTFCQVNNNLFSVFYEYRRIAFKILSVLLSCKKNTSSKADGVLLYHNHDLKVQIIMH